MLLQCVVGDLHVVCDHCGCVDVIPNAESILTLGRLPAGWIADDGRALVCPTCQTPPETKCVEVPL